MYVCILVQTTASRGGGTEVFRMGREAMQDYGSRWPLHVQLSTLLMDVGKCFCPAYINYVMLESVQ